MANKKNRDKEERREARRKRRIRNQIFAYIFLILLLAGIGAGGFFGIKQLINKLQVNKAIEETESDNDASVSGDATMGVIATPEDMNAELESLLEQQQEEPVVQENAEARAIVDSMTLEQKVANLFICSPEDILDGVNNATKAGDSTKEALEELAIGGLVYVKSNVSSKDQFTEMLGATQDMYREIYGTDMWLMADMDNASDYVESGINLMFLPAEGYSSVDGVRASGVMSFPFQDGNAPDQSEEVIDDMRELRFNYYHDAISNGASMIMMSDTVASNATGDTLPCTLSYAMITEVLRDEFGFDGVIVTGPMNKSVITDSYSAGDAALMAIQAGADMIYRSENVYEAYDAILTAVQSGTLDEARIDESLMRIYTAKFQ